MSLTPLAGAVRPRARRFAAVLTIAALAASSPLAAQADPGWQRDLETALQRAAEQNRPLFVAVVMPGERGSDAVVAHYSDARIRSLLQACASLRIDVGAGRPDERVVLDRYLGARPRDPVVVPHHVVVAPDGQTVLSSAAWQLTRGQLEWLLVDGLRKVDPGFAWDLADDARAPEELSYGEIASTERTPQPPPTAEAVKAALAQLKKGSADWRGSMDAYATVLRSEDKAAIAFVESQLRGRGRFIAGFALGTIARVSPVVWAPVLEDFLADRDAGNRETAARGLATMASDKSRKAVLKALDKEAEPAVRGWLLRAAVATGPGDKAVVRAVERALDKAPEAAVRIQAAVAAGALEDAEAAHRLLVAALEDEDPLVRSAAAYAVAARRDEQQLSVLRAVLEVETDAEARHWLELAVAVVADRGDLRGFRNFRREVLGERRDFGDGGGGPGRWPGGGSGRGAGDGPGAGPGGGAPGGGRGGR